MSREGTAVLRQALRLIPDADHWTKFNMHTVKWRGTSRETPAYCLLGAVETASAIRSTRYPNREFQEATARLRAVIGPVARAPGFGGYNDLTRWNDMSRRRYAEVREAIEKAIRVRSW